MPSAPDDHPTIGAVVAPEVHCATLNVRRRVPHAPGHADAWERRRDAVVALVASEQPTVLAVQEALPAQTADLTARLGSRWEPVVVGRGARGGGEAVGLFLDRERLDVVERRTWALSRTPSRPGSRSWATAFPRHAVGAVVADRTTGREFTAIATHLDVASSWARLRGAQLLGRIVRERGLPAVVMADWNCPAGSAPWRALADAGVVDSWGRASRQVGEAYGTYPHYREPRVGGRRIDGVLVTEDAVVDRVAVNVRRPGGVWPSDHAAVHAVVRWAS
ncbi:MULTISPECIES: endonuclease/exonuclease/phosphatase family protein [unclassified Curtobacterium]|uniref:endonuclease/exonuclease/phosphatase family protein n=1 Tax=unclassified Curtobacterium TaxID=257496 RepID=UPI00203CB122|nr:MULTISPECIES: endonuclease/exonuclease/phosphatase family protein [unclassified Curtobacterium]MCM3522704.1 endonuclease/exonuclease/phosphatase family protein [Curtobacterium sp. P97]MDB6427358.1 endonuclease/exonuclease/phosphatase family protein [Curtobacterium sp. 20TX0008]MDT0210528.1 endonuclease/exonuclease/phosphatase family protein [Curtobacterium sp. BRD11]